MVEEGAAGSGCGIRGLVCHSLLYFSSSQARERRATVKTDCAEIKKGKNTHGVMSGPFGVKMLLINLQMS